MSELGPFRVGDRPADVLDLVISRPDDVEPLSGFTSASVRMRLPDESAQVWTGFLVQPNVVRSTWPTDPFPLAGQYRVRAELSGDAGVSEKASWARFWVRP